MLLGDKTAIFPKLSVNFPVFSSIEILISSSYRKMPMKVGDAGDGVSGSPTV